MRMRIEIGRVVDTWPRALALLAFLLLTAGASALAQESRSTPEELRRQVERRFDVLVVREGLALRPRNTVRGLRTIEVSGGNVVIDGSPATGGELRTRLGDDGDLVIQLTYLDAAVQRKLFDASAGSTPPETPAVPAPAAEPAPPAPPEIAPPDRRDVPRNRRSREQIRIGRSVHIDADELVMGDVVAIGGSVTVLGEVRGEVVAVGGSVNVGPDALIRRDVTIVGGSLRREPTSRIEGEIHEIGIGGFDGDWGFGPSLAGLWWGWTMSAAFALLASIVRVAVLCLLAALVVLLGRDYVERVSARAAAEPLKAGAIGFLAQVLFLPILIITIVLLVVTIVGIPLVLLIPFAILGLGVLAFVGFTAVGYKLGRLLISRLGWSDPGPIGAAVTGILLLVSPILVARLIGLGGGVLYPMTFALGLFGVLIEYLAWTIGFGAVALNRFSKQPSMMMEG